MTSNIRRTSRPDSAAQPEANEAPRRSMGTAQCRRRSPTCTLTIGLTSGRSMCFLEDVMRFRPIPTQFHLLSQASDLHPYRLVLEPCVGDLRHHCHKSSGFSYSLGIAKIRTCRWNAKVKCRPENPSPLVEILESEDICTICGSLAISTSYVSTSINQVKSDLVGTDHCGNGRL